MNANSLSEYRTEELQSHPWQKNIPNIEGGDWTAFIADVRARGVKEPIRVSLRTGSPVIVDGHQRVRAAREVGYQTLEAITEQFADEGEEITFSAGAARFRRHLTDRQRGEIARAYREFFKSQADENLKQGGRPKKGLQNFAKVSTPKVEPVNVAQKAAELVGTSREQLRKIDAIETSGLEPVKEAWGQEKISTHAAHKIIKAPDPVQEAISSYAVPVNDGLLVAKDKALSKDVAEGRKTVPEAVSVAKQMKEARQAEKKELDYDITHKVLDALEAVTLLEFSEYHRAAHSKATTRHNVNAVEIGIEEAITHLQKAAEAIRIVEMSGDNRTITANLN